MNRPSDADPDTDVAESPHRDITQWLAVFVIVSGTVLVFAQSFGFAEVATKHLQLLIAGGVILAGGPKAIRVLVRALV